MDTGLKAVMQLYLDDGNDDKKRYSFFRKGNKIMGAAYSDYFPSNRGHILILNIESYMKDGIINAYSYEAFE